MKKMCIPKSINLIKSLQSNDKCHNVISEHLKKQEEDRYNYFIQ